MDQSPDLAVPGSPAMRSARQSTRAYGVSTKPLPSAVSSRGETPLSSPASAHTSREQCAPAPLAIDPPLSRPTLADEVQGPEKENLALAEASMLPATATRTNPFGPTHLHTQSPPSAYAGHPAQSPQTAQSAPPLPHPPLPDQVHPATPQRQPQPSHSTSGHSTSGHSTSGHSTSGHSGQPSQSVQTQPQTPQPQAQAQAQAQAQTQTQTQAQAQAAQAAQAQAAAASPQSPRRTGHPRIQKRTSVGPWDFVKSIGAGSMGQVKLAVNRYTRQTAAVKIVPKAFTQRHKEGKESNEAKDARVIREAALGKLLNHPNISALYDVYSMSSHYYLVFEYISGGQMLDYIISHGTVKEVQARRFARSIASALDYCHRNSIVHRDLKIENILIADGGDVKLIDFGLSNLFRRDSLLSTFCGSLYFAAPELLNAQPYVGPEVDVWSFGVVLYVLVCGKVPFEDKSMAVLHAKIKRGVVEYPQWLSPLCTDLLSRMLVVSPSDRVTMREIIHHPWMNKGFDDVVSSHVPNRRPLELPLDPRVLQEMVDIRLAPDLHKLETELEGVLQSPMYRDAVAAWYDANSSSTTLPIRAADPLNSYHPFISMYFLTRERLDRDANNVGGSNSASSVGSFGSGTSASSPVTPLDPARRRQRSGTTGSAERAPAAPQIVVPGGRRVVTGPAASATPATPAAPATAAGQPGPPIGAPPTLALPADPTIPQSARTGRTRARTHGQWDAPSFGEQYPRSDEPQRSQPGSPTSATPERRGNISTLLRRISLRRRQARSDQTANIQNDRLGRVSSMRAPAPPNMGPSPLSSRGNSRENVDMPEFQYPPRADTSRNSSVRRRPVTPLLPDPDSEPPSAAAGTSLASPGGSTSHHPQVQITKSPRPSQDTPRAPQPHSQQQQLAVPNGSRTGLHSRAKSQGAPHPALQQHASASSTIQSQRIDEGMPSIESPKQVFFKGFFSVQSTSTRPLLEIRSEIIRVLRLLGIDYVEIKGGFSCIAGASPASVAPTTPGTPGPSRHRRGPSSFSSPFQSPMRTSDLSNSSTDSVEIGGSDMLGNMSSKSPTPVRFEISIVRVPLLSLHGVQFKKLTGNVWQYKTIAQEILADLHL